MREIRKGSKTASPGTRAVLFVFLAGGAWSAAAAGELSGLVTLTSEYIYRGQAASDSDPALQIGADYAFDSGFFAGIWASTIDIENVFSTRDAELDVYLGYHIAPEGRLSFTGTLLRYTYPGQRNVSGRNYDYSELLVSATLDGRHSLTLGYTDDLYGLGGIGRYVELRSERTLASAWVLSVGLGGSDLTDYGGARYLHWDAGLSARFSWLTIDLRWHDNEETGSAIGGISAGSRAVLSLSAVF